MVGLHKYEDSEYYCPECRTTDVIPQSSTVCASELRYNGHPDHERNISSAANILKQASDTIFDRSITRDAGKEKSMGRTVDFFNGLMGDEILTEREGWLFMACVKLGRSQQGKFHLDDYLDATAYVALAGEAAAKEVEDERELCDRKD